MRSRTRPRRTGFYAFWTVLLIGGGGLLAWRQGWLPVGFDDAAGGLLGQSPPLADDVEDENDGELGESLVGDPIVFNSQNEPGDDGFISSTDFSSEPSSNEPRPLPREIEDDRPRPEIPANAPPNFDAARPLRPLSDDDGKPARRVVDPAVRVVAGERRVSQTSKASPLPLTLRDPILEIPAIDALIEDGDYAEAHRHLSAIYWKEPQRREMIRKRIEAIAKSIYFSPRPHYMPAYKILSGDRLSEIAKKYDVPWQYLVRLNQVDPRKIQSGQDLKVIRGPFSAWIELSRFELTIHNHGYFVRRYPVGIGKDGQSPIGTFKVLLRESNPVYYGPDGMVIQRDDPTNPLGERWIDIGDGYGIHGTIDPKSIGRAESRGCIRMLAKDVAEVFDMLGVGSQVIIRR